MSAPYGLNQLGRSDCWWGRFSPRSAKWGGWDSNPRPTDYESAVITPALSGTLWVVRKSLVAGERDSGSLRRFRPPTGPPLTQRSRNHEVPRDCVSAARAEVPQ